MKSIALLITFLIFSSSIIGQTDCAILQYGSTNSANLTIGDDVYIPVTIDYISFSAVCSLGLSLVYDNLVLSWYGNNNMMEGFVNINPKFDPNEIYSNVPCPGVLNFLWFDLVSPCIEFEDGEILFYYKFKYLGGETQLSFGSSSGINAWDNFGNNYFIDGCVCENPTIPAIFHTSFGSNMIEGAEISIEGENMLTDSLGIAIFNLSPGTYDYSVSKEGFLSETGSFSINDNAENIYINLTISTSQYEFITGQKQWNTINYSDYEFPVIQCLGTQVYKFGIYEIIDGEVYFEILKSTDEFQTDWTHIGYLREDVENHQLIYRDLEGEEGLIYDFEMEVGDIITIDNVYLETPNIEMECVGIETIIVNGEEKIQYELHNNEFDQSEIWIEGMGSNNGILSSGYYCTGITGSSSELLCYSFNDELIYSNPTFSACFYDTFYPKFISSSSDTAYKNIYYEYQLEVNDYNVESYTWSASDIPEGLSFDPSTGILSGTPNEAGTYQITFLTANNDIGFTTDQMYFSLLVELDDGIAKNKENELRIYPNLFTDIVKVEANDKEEYRLHIYNGLGIEIDNQLFTGSINMNCSQYAKGFYFFKVVDKNQQTVMIQKMIRY
jgi:hypothetical protein